MDYKIAVESDNQDVFTQVRKGLRAFNQSFIGPGNQPVAISLRDLDGSLIGGCLGAVFADMLAIDILWIEESCRGGGIGTELLGSIEVEGKRLGATKAVLDTFQFQAKGFYEKQGYVEFGRIEDCAAGFDRFYMLKRL